MNDDYSLVTESILKYIRGEQLTTEENQALEAWCARSEDNRQLPDLFKDKEWVEEQLRRLPGVPTEEIWQLILQRTTIDRVPAPAIRRRAFSPVGIAAAVLLLLGVAVSYFYRLAFLPDDQQVPVIARTAMVGQFTYGGKGGRVIDSTSARAKPFDLQLPDGSKVRLCAGSTLTYTATWSGGSREVDLRGQAEFDVVGRKDMPFIVHTVRSDVQVLGTHFNVMDYADDHSSEITLLRGQVAVVHEGKRYLLKPSQQVTIGDKGVAFQTLVHPDGAIGWGENDPYIEFDNADLNTVAQRLGRLYGAKVYHLDNTEGARITGIFRQQDPFNTNVAHLRDAEWQSAMVEGRNNDSILISAWRTQPADK